MESARETFLTVFGQKITHSLRSALMYKYSCLTTSGLTSQEPGTVVSRFVGDADTVENLLYGLRIRDLPLCFLFFFLSCSYSQELFRKICWKRRLRTEEL